MKKRMLSLAEEDKLRAHLNELRIEGAKRFGILWLQANLCAVNAASATGVDASDLRTKILLSETCFRILALCEKKEAA